MQHAKIPNQVKGKENWSKGKSEVTNVKKTQIKSMKKTQAGARAAERLG